MNIQPIDFLSAKEAAEFLGVKRDTLYAYASRGLLRSHPAAGRKERRYLRTDVERLKVRAEARSGHGPVAAAALHFGEPVLESALTLIDERGFHYRGHSAPDLARSGVPFESVAELLWSGFLPPERPRFVADGPGVPLREFCALLPPDAPPLTLLPLLVPALAAADAARFSAPREAELIRARALILRMAALLGLRAGRKHVQQALHKDSVAGALGLALQAPPGEPSERALDCALVLCADHELNTSTFTVRVAASSGADLYACVSAALATLTGPRHGGACDRTEALVAETGRPERAGKVIHDRSRRGESVPGFGHQLYPAGDPRAPVLLAAARDLCPRSMPLRTLLALCQAMADAGREPPSLEVGLVAVSLALGLPPGSAAGIFAVGRAAGWIAHILEQRSQGALLRPRARYVGA